MLVKKKHQERRWKEKERRTKRLKKEQVSHVLITWYSAALRQFVRSLLCGGTLQAV